MDALLAQIFQQYASEPTRGDSILDLVLSNVIDFASKVVFEPPIPSSVNKKYEMFLGILHHAVDMFVPVRRISVSKIYLPSYLQNMYDHWRCLFHATKRSQSANDWDKFHRFSLKFDHLLYKYKHMEKDS